MKIGTGIGAGLISAAAAPRLAGLRGRHRPRPCGDGRERLCRCGNVGCLEALAGGGALRRDGEAARAGPQPASRRSSPRRAGSRRATSAYAAAHGDPVSVELIAHAGRLVGQAGRRDRQLLQPVADRASAAVSRSRRRPARDDPADRLPPLAPARHARPRRPPLPPGGNGGVVGAAAMVANELFAPDYLPLWRSTPASRRPGTRRPRVSSRGATERPGIPSCVLGVRGVEQSCGGFLADDHRARQRRAASRPARRAARAVCALISFTSATAAMRATRAQPVCRDRRSRSSASPGGRARGRARRPRGRAAARRAGVPDAPAIDCATAVTATTVSPRRCARRRHLDRAPPRVPLAAEHDQRVRSGRSSKLARIVSARPAHPLDEHRLTLAVGADDRVVIAHRQLDDRVEARERAVPREHLLDGHPRVPGAEDMDEATGEDRVGAGGGHLRDRVRLGLDAVEQRPGSRDEPCLSRCGQSRVDPQQPV